MGRRDDFIRSLGVEAYRVGGSVRDEILGLTPKDDDYLVRGVSLEKLHALLDEALGATGSIKPLRMRQGAQFGWRVLHKNLGAVEITLPRAERGTGDRQSMEVYVDPSMTLEEDAKRRDFTFNALYKRIDDQQMTIDPYVGTDGVFIDPTGCGLYDLQHRLIRTTHPESFADDPLRILRALRFNARGFDFTLDAMTEMFKYGPGVDGMTAKGYASGTLYDEFCKILMGERPSTALRAARDSNVLRYAMPEIWAMMGFEQGSRYHDLTTDEHTFVALETAAKVDAPLRVRWALLFHDAGKPDTAWKGEDGRLHYYWDKSHGDPAEVGYLSPYDGHVLMNHEDYSEVLWREAAERMNVPARIREDVATLIREHMLNVSPKNLGVKVRRMRVRMGDVMLRDLFLMRACDLSGKGSKKRNQKQIAGVAAMESARQDASCARVPASRKDLAVSGNDCFAKGLRDRSIGGALDVILDEVVCDPSPQKLSRAWQLSRVESLANHIKKVTGNA
jgi:tRNA nucleotidyltransferase/poly(A) polymerase